MPIDTYLPPILSSSHPTAMKEMSLKNFFEINFFKENKNSSENRNYSKTLRNISKGESNIFSTSTAIGIGLNAFISEGNLITGTTVTPTCTKK